MYQLDNSYQINLTEYFNSCKFDIFKLFNGHLAGTTKPYDDFGGQLEQELPPTPVRIISEPFKLKVCDYEHEFVFVKDGIGNVHLCLNCFTA